eukprot:5228747-Prymnesium_polylepis.1
MSADADIRNSLALSANLRRVLGELMAAKTAGGPAGGAQDLSSEGARLLMEMRRLETEIARTAVPSSGALEASQAKVDEADAAHRALRYERSRALAGIAEARSAVPKGSEGFEVGGEAEGLDHRQKLARLATECHERRS